jgi:hypothetical protein
MSSVSLSGQFGHVQQHGMLEVEGRRLDADIASAALAATTMWPNAGCLRILRLA